jgi:hypothetical protein
MKGSSDHTGLPPAGGTSPLFDLRLLAVKR